MDEIFSFFRRIKIGQFPEWNNEIHAKKSIKKECRIKLILLQKTNIFNLSEISKILFSIFFRILEQMERRKRGIFPPIILWQNSWWQFAVRFAPRRVVILKTETKNIAVISWLSVSASFTDDSCGGKKLTFAKLNFSPILLPSHVLNSFLVPRSVET